MLRIFRTIFIQRQVLWHMTIKEWKAKYVNSFLGIWWASITPILVMLAISFVFTKVINIDIDNFPVFSLAGIIPWFFFSTSLSEVTVSFVSKSNLFKQFNFPYEFIPVSVILSNFLNFILGFLFLVLIFYFSNPQVLYVILWLPVIIFAHLIFTVGIGLLFACINIFFRDLSHLLGVLLLFWFWMTPIFYSLEMVPASYRWICLVNPMTIYVELYRDVLFRAVIPSAAHLLLAFSLSLFSLFAGYLIFNKVEHHIVKRI
ncbi:MAG: hypothetical protein GF375_00125 [Candidatus Omnitrophica bacterium]|nr:hypothetical protein [Candidatus Omnitrophota bacterium]MBD3268575.1 hypothetical protein [Candidatus Omnitrophota bacterium]